jgi:hypothetical protein
MLAMVNSMMDVSISNGVLDVLDVLGQQKKKLGGTLRQPAIFGGVLDYHSGDGHTTMNRGL